ncbi:tape measure protein [Echinicola rosea]|uniref:Tape measure protein N-terminal domain-containing protein n=1 Tax=Echinicola rosea TaxID=1807691 RepID=A0ABQ1V1C2_9BACT|nr:tape measure protein [Echinicola rosea]GGF34501.1 hypothetical protein GCM10011339_23470 [Echinicola rosea]
MAVQVNDGGLYWKAGIDTSGLERDAKKVEDIFDGLTKEQANQEKKLLSKLSQNYREVYQDGLRAFQQMTPEMQKQLSILQSFQTELSQVSSAQKKLDSQFQKGRISQVEYNRATAGLSVRTQELKTNIEQYSNSIRANNAVMNAANGSIDQKRAKLQQLQKSYTALSESERQNAAVGGRLEKQIRSLDKEITKLDRSMKGARSSGKVLNQILLATTGLFTIQQGSRLVNDIIQVRGEIEKLQVSFETMLQSKADAERLMADIVQIATSTPFKLTEVADATKQLLAYGFAQEEIKGELLAIGNVASGVGATFQEVAYAYGTLKTQGRAFARDIRQFTTRGIPVVRELAEQFNVTEKEINEMVSAGKIGFPEVQKAFQSLTTEGGIFFNLMEKQSETVTGQIAKLQDRLQLMFNEIGKSNEGLIKGGIQSISFLIENYERVIDTIGVLVTAYGSYRAALVITQALEAAVTAGEIKSVSVKGLLRLATLNLQKAQALLNTTMLANPYVAVATALGVLVGAFVFLRDEVEEVEKSQDRLNRLYTDVNNSVSEQQAKIGQLVSILQDQNVAESVRLKAYKDLNNISPDIVRGLSFEEAKTKDLTAAIYGYINALRDRREEEALINEGVTIAQKRAELEQRLIDQQERLNQLRKESQTLSSSGAASNSGQIAAANREIQTTQENLSRLLQSQEDINRKLGDTFDDTSESVQKQIEFYKQVQKAFKDTSSEYKQYEDEIQKLREKLTDTEDQPERAAQNKAYFEQIIQENTEGLNALDKSADDFEKRAKEYREKILSAQQNLEAFSTKSDKKEQNEAVKEREEVLKELEKLEDKYYKKSFERGEQEIRDTERRFKELRELAVKNGLGGRVVDRIDSLEDRATGDIAYRTETSLLEDELKKREQLYREYTDYVNDFGIQAARERYGVELEEVKSYIEKAQKEYQNLASTPAGDRSGVEQERLEFLQEVLDKEKEYQNKQYDQLLLSVQNYEQKRNALTEQYQRERAEIVSRGDFEYLQEFDRQFKEQITKLNEEAAINVTGFQKFFDNIETMSRSAALEGIAQLRKEFEKLFKKGLIDEGQLDNFITFLRNAEENVQNELPEGLSEISSQLNDIVGTIGDVNSGFGQTLRVVSDLIQRTAQVKTNIEAFKTAQSTGNALGAIGAGLGIAGGVFAGIQAVAGIVNSISQQSRLAEQQVLEFQSKVEKGELRLNALYRERRALAAEIENSMTKNFQSQTNALQQNIREINEEFNGIFGQLTRSVSGEDLSKLNDSFYQDSNNLFKKYMDKLGDSVYEVEPRIERGFLGIGKTVVRQFESLAGMSYENIEKIYDQLTPQAKELFDQLKEQRAEMEEWTQQLEELREAYKDALVGGIDGLSIADTIIEGFRQGKRAAEDFGTDLEEIVRNAMLEGFKYRILEEPLNKIIDQFGEDALDGLDNNEIEKFVKSVNGVITSSGPAFDAMNKALSEVGISLEETQSNAGSAVGSIQRSITEETGSELAGLFRSFYDNQKIANNYLFEQLQIGLQQVNYLQEIAQWQARSYKELVSINRNTKGNSNGYDRP